MSAGYWSSSVSSSGGKLTKASLEKQGSGEGGGFSEEGWRPQDPHTSEVIVGRLPVWSR